MKKLVGLFAAALISACFITGCGGDKNESSMAEDVTQMLENDTSENTTTDITESGIVSDSDGIIGNDDEENTNDNTDDNNNETSSAESSDNESSDSDMNPDDKIL